MIRQNHSHCVRQVLRHGTRQMIGLISLCGSAERTAIVLLIVSLLLLPAYGQPPSGDPLLLPFSTTESVVVHDSETGQSIELTGTIEDLTGDRILLRRGGAGRVDTIRLRDVKELRFAKSHLFDEGLRQAKEHNWAAAVTAFDQASIAEPRRWVQREIDAAAARASLALFDFDDAVKRIERIAASDSQTRHLNLLPLVWDERVGPQEKYQCETDQLKAPSEIRRLCAASALLEDRELRLDAAGVLVQLKTSANAGIQEIATAQLWRMQLLNDLPLRSGELRLWKDRATRMDYWLRGGPLTVVGRFELRAHKYDDAAASLMWLPTMQADDRGLAARCLLSAAEAVRQSGRPKEASRILAEAGLRFPDTFSVQQMKRKVKKPGPE